MGNLYICEYAYSLNYTLSSYKPTLYLSIFTLRNRTFLLPHTGKVNVDQLKVNDIREERVIMLGHYLYMSTISIYYRYTPDTLTLFTQI